MDAIAAEVFSIAQQNQKLEKENKSLRSEVSGLKEEISRLHQLSNDLNDLDQYNRKNNVIIYGLPGNQEKTDTVTLKEFIGEFDNNIVINDTDICNIHRLPKPPNSKGPKPMIVKFTRYGIKKEIYMKRSRLKQFNQNRSQFISFGENLTKKNNILFKQCKQALKDQLISQLWTEDGRILVRQQERIIQIKSIQDIQ